MKLIIYHHSKSEAVSLFLCSGSTRLWWPKTVNACDRLHTDASEALLTRLRHIVSQSIHFYFYAVPPPPPSLLSLQHKTTNGQEVFFPQVKPPANMSVSLNLVQSSCILYISSPWNWRSGSAILQVNVIQHCKNRKGIISAHSHDADADLAADLAAASAAGAWFSKIQGCVITWARGKRFLGSWRRSWKRTIVRMYIYHVLNNALSAHVIHINLNVIFYTHVEHSPAKTIYIKYCKNKKHYKH